MPETTNVTIRVPNDLLQRIDRVCAAFGESRSATLVHMLRDGTDRSERWMRMNDSAAAAVIRGISSNPRIAQTLFFLAGEPKTPEQAEKWMQEANNAASFMKQERMQTEEAKLAGHKLKDEGA